MPLNTLEQWKFNKLKETYGEFNSPDELLTLAIESETIKKDLSFGDIAFAKFSQDQTNLFEYARLLEKSQS